MDERRARRARVGAGLVAGLLAGVLGWAWPVVPGWTGYDEGLVADERGEYATPVDFKAGQKEGRRLMAELMARAKALEPRAKDGDPEATAELEALMNRIERLEQMEHQEYLRYSQEREAVRRYRQAAEQGSAVDQVSLGNMYEEGRGVPQDDREAAHWYRLAAEQGNAEAQFNLGVMYAEGRGVPQDFLEAYQWLSLAAGNLRGEEREKVSPWRDRVAQRLPPEQLVQAQARVRAWTPKVAGGAAAPREPKLETALRPQIEGPEAKIRPPVFAVDQPPRARVAGRPHRHALVIGIDTYRQRLPAAEFAAHDATVMHRYLTEALGYPEENVALLLNAQAAKSDLEKYVEHWLPDRVDPGDEVFIYFSGHGAPVAATKQAYLVPYDGDPAFMAATGYPLARLYERLAALPAKQVVVVLDTCFSGAGGRSVLAAGTRPVGLSLENPLFAGSKLVVLAATRGDQIATTYREQGHGLFTYVLLKGLQGEGDTDRDGQIELRELFAYVQPQVERLARRELHEAQTPQLLGSPEALARVGPLVEAGPR